MSFNDLMSSARGPGVIGIVMALIVLLGFALLFMFAADEGFQGADMSIESLIAQQAKDIEFSKVVVENNQKLLGDAAERSKKNKELNRLKRGSLTLQERRITLEKNVESGKADAVFCNKVFDDYKDQYRAYVRGKAKGECMEILQTQSGVVYKNVSIREVTAIGIQIRHDDGQKRIPFEELPETMKDYYQFDLKQKAVSVAREQATWNDHEAAVSVANLASDRQVAAETAMEAKALREKMIRSIAIKESRIHSLGDEIKNLEEAISKEIKKSVSNAPQMRVLITNKQSDLSALHADIARMQARLSN